MKLFKKHTKDETVVPTKAEEKKKKTVVPFKKKDKKKKAETVGAETIVSKKKGSPKEFFKKIGSTIASHKKIAGGVCAGLVAVIVVITVVVAIVNRDDSEKIMRQEINDLGTSFYEDFYYQSAGNGDDDERTEFLGKFTDIGIKVSLENLIRYYVTTDDYDSMEGALKDADVSERIEALEKSWFTSKNYNCDFDNTKVVIYPQDPYGSTDYKLEIVTACGFESETTDDAE